MGAVRVAVHGVEVDFGAAPEPPKQELSPQEREDIRTENARRAAAERERLEGWSA